MGGEWPGPKEKNESTLSTARETEAESHAMSVLSLPAAVDDHRKSTDLSCIR
jgi:hypothetical protein